MILDLYTDGSYSKSIPNRTSGGMVLLEKDKVVFAQRYISEKREQVSMANVGGELIAAMGGLFVAAGYITQTVGDGTSSAGQINLYHDYKGIYEFIDGEPGWIARKEGSRLYVASVCKFREIYPNIHIKFMKVKAHSGNKWNDVVDSIANNIVPVECDGKMLPDYVL